MVLTEKLSQQMFREMIKRAVDYKQNPSDFMDEVMQELEVHLSECRNSVITDVLILQNGVVLYNFRMFTEKKLKKSQ